METRQATSALVTAVLYLRLLEPIWLRWTERLLAGLTYHLPLSAELIGNTATARLRSRSPSPQATRRRNASKEAKAVESETEAKLGVTLEEPSLAGTSVPMKELGELKLVDQTVKLKTFRAPATFQNHYLYENYAWLILLGALCTLVVLGTSQIYFTWLASATAQEWNLNWGFAAGFALYSGYQLLNLLFLPNKRSSYSPAATLASISFGFVLSWTIAESVDQTWVNFGLSGAAYQARNSLLDLVYALDLDGGSLEKYAVSDYRLKLSLAIACAALTPALLFPGLRFAKCYLISLHREKRELLRLCLRVAYLSPMAIVYFMLASYVYREQYLWLDDAVTRGWIWLSLLLVFTASRLVVFRSLFQSCLHVAQLRQKRIAKQPGSITVQNYRNLILYIYDSAMVAVVQLLAPVFLLWSLALMYWSVSQEELGIPWSLPKYTLPFQALGPIWRPIIRFLVFWICLVTGTTTTFGIMTARAFQSVDAIPFVE